MNKKSLTIKILIVICFNDLLETISHVCFKKGAMLQPDLELHRWNDVVLFVTTMMTSGYIWMGFVIVFIIFASWSTILSKIDLSVATPATSFSYVMIAAVSWLLFNEHISPLRWVGIFFILAGVAAVSFSAEKDAEKPHER